MRAATARRKRRALPAPARNREAGHRPCSATRDGAHRPADRRHAPPVANSPGGEVAIFACRARPLRPGRCIWLRCPAGLRSPPCKSPTPGLPRRCRRRHRRRPQRNGARLPAPEVRVVPPAPPVREAPLRLWHRAPQARQAPRARLARPRGLAVRLRLAGRPARAARRGLGRRWAPADPQRPADRPDLLDPASPRNTRSTGPRRIVRRRQLVHACGCSENVGEVAGHSGTHSSGSAAFGSGNSGDGGRSLVSRFRSSHHCEARSFANFGIEGH
jgi:hypothetical protein